MALGTVRFEEILDKSLTQVERGLLRDLLTKKDERAPLRKLLDEYDACIEEERGYKEELRKVLDGVVRCKDGYELEAFDSRIEDMKDNIRYCHNNQNRIIDEIFGKVRWSS